MPPPQGYEQPPPHQPSPPPQQATNRASNSAPAPSGSGRVEQRRNPDGSTSIQIGAQRSNKGIGGAGNEEEERTEIKEEQEESDADV